MAQFYQVAGTQLALPDYCRVDLAYSWTYVFSTPAAGADLSRKVTGNLIEIPLSIFFVLTTSAAVANREAAFTIGDADGHTLLVVGASSVQTANTTQDYTGSAGFGFAYGPVTTTNVFGFPPTACPVGYTINLTVAALQAADQMSGAVLTVVRVPTGPALASATPELTPTPLIT